MKYTIFFGLCLAVLFTFSSCQEDIDPGGTATQNMSGDWYVELKIDGVDIYGIGYWQLSTYNTAADVNTEMILDDHGLWPYKGKVSVDYAAQTFTASNVESIAADSIFATVTGGIILEDAATTSGGNVSDSIHYMVEFTDDPGTVYEVAGYRRTGFPEDDH